MSAHPRWWPVFLPCLCRPVCHIRIRVFLCQSGLTGLCFPGWRNAVVLRRASNPSAKGRCPGLLLSQPCSLVQGRPHLHSTWFKEEKAGLPVCMSVVALTAGCGPHLPQVRWWDSFWDTDDPLPHCHHLEHTQVPVGSCHCGLGLPGPGHNGMQRPLCRRGAGRGGMDGRAVRDIPRSDPYPKDVLPTGSTDVRPAPGCCSHGGPLAATATGLPVSEPNSAGPLARMLPLGPAQERQWLGG